MEAFFTVLFGIILFAVWRSGRNAADKLRNDVEGLEQQIGTLRGRVNTLERAAASNAASTAAPATPTGPVSPPEVVPQPTPHPKPAEAVTAQHAPSPPIAPLRPPAPSPTPVAPPVPAAAAPVPPPMPAAPSPVIPKPPVETPKIIAHETEPVSAGALFSLEEKLGANWLNKLGVAILVVGLAFFLAYKLQTWGPAGKVLCGYSVSLVLLGGGVWLERKVTYRIFARGGIGGGWALAFFTTYAMYHISAARVLPSLAADLVLMLLVAAGMVAHSLRYNSQAVTGLAFLLGFATLLTSHLEATGADVWFSLMASVVLAVALVIVTTLRHWAWLELTGLIAVYLSHLVWLTRVLPENHAAFTEFWPSTALILLYWLIFRLAYVLRTPRDRSEENISSLSAVLNSIGVLGLLKYQSAHPEWAFWALVALGAIEMGLAFQVRARRRQAFVVLSTIATVLLVSAVPFKFQGVTWPVLWLVQAQVLAICGLRLGEPVFRRLGLLVGLVTGGVLAFHEGLPLLLFRLSYPDPSHHVSLTVALVLAAILYWVHAEVYPRRWPQIAADDREAFVLRITSWLGAAAAAAAFWVALPDFWVPVGWLALVLALGFAAHWFRAVRLAIQADLLALASAAVMVFHHVGPLFLFRMDYPDPSHHPAETIVLALAALAYWVRSEVYSRALPRLDSVSASDFDVRGWQGFALPLLSWLGAGAAASALWVALPDRWVPVGWLALVLLLALVAQLLRSAPMTLEADALSLLSAMVLAFHHVAPLVLFRLDYPDPSHHPVETVVLAIAAVAYWIRSELYPRLIHSNASAPSSDFDLGGWQAFALPVISWLGVAAAASALWVFLPAPWVVVGWLGLVFLLGIGADWVKAQTFALQADLLAVVALPGLFFWDAWTHGWWDHQAPLIASIVLLYAGMRRKTVLEGSGRYVAPAYSWTATLLMTFVAAEISSVVFLTPAYAVLGLILFEIGRLSRKGFLRWQGFLLVVVAFGRFLAINLPDSFGFSQQMRQPALFVGGISLTNSLLLEVLVLAAAGYWLFERTRNRERCSGREYGVGLAADSLGALSIALWFAYRFPSTWVPVPGGEAWVTAIWAGMATMLLALAWLMRRRAFLVQAMALVVAVVARGFFLDLFADSPTDFWHGPLFHLGVTSIILLAALPFAFLLRREGALPASTISLAPDLAMLLRIPEQWFFFAAFALELVSLAFKLSSGHITIAWSLLGLGVFLFALAVGERSFRLTGLGLLLVCVGKIGLIDIFNFSPSDRYTTLIVLGLALLAVSFLYTRFGAALRKLL